MSDTNQRDIGEPELPAREALDRERYELLRRLENWLETPMLLLAFAWLALLVGELIWGESFAFEVLGTIIWMIFILDFALEIFLAPDKAAYLKRNWLTAIALLVPALRIFRVFLDRPANTTVARRSGTPIVQSAEFAEPRYAGTGCNAATPGFRLCNYPHGTRSLCRRSRYVCFRE